MNRSFLTVLMYVFIAGLAACSGGGKPVGDDNRRAATSPFIEPTSAVSDRVGLTPKTTIASQEPDYKNTTYEFEGTPVSLMDGYAEVEAAPGSASKITTQYFGNEAFGDLNGDGKEDVAFLITQSGGGSGTFFYAVAALQTDAGYLGTNAVFLGDRIAPKDTLIENGIVIVNFADRNPDEPFTTKPSVGKTTHLQVKDGILVDAAGPS